MLSSIFFYLWYLAYLLELWCLDSMLSGIMLPRFHDSSFIYDVWHSAFWNYVASIPCSLFHLRYLNSAFPILELCCLDSMFLFLFTVCAFWIMELCCLDFVVLVLFTTFAFCILELCCLDSMFLLSFTVFEILHSPFWNYIVSILCSFFSRYVHSGIMSPRFHNHCWFTHRIWNSTYLLHGIYVASIP